MNLLDPAALESLAALAEAGSFERAAQLLSITQSAVSQRLRALEAQVGTAARRARRPLRLTEPGKVLLRIRAPAAGLLRADARARAEGLAPVTAARARKAPAHRHQRRQPRHLGAAGALTPWCTRASAKATAWS